MSSPNLNDLSLISIEEKYLDSNWANALLVEKGYGRCPWCVCVFALNGWIINFVCVSLCWSWLGIEKENAYFTNDKECVCVHSRPGLGEHFVFKRKMGDSKFFSHERNTWARHQFPCWYPLFFCFFFFKLQSAHVKKKREKEQN